MNCKQIQLRRALHSRAIPILFLLIAGLAILTPVRAQQQDPDQGQKQTAAQGQDQVSWYQVEVIVFAYTHPDTDGESWYVNPGLPHEQNAIDLITAAVEPPAKPLPASPAAAGQGGNQDQAGSAAAQLAPYMLLSADHNRLDQVYHILSISGAYRPLYHASWQQPGLDGDHARYVHIQIMRGGQGGDDPPEGEQAAPAENGTGTADAAQEKGAPADNTTAAGNNVPSYQPPQPAVDAMLRLRANHFLHIDLDAAYFPQDPSILQSSTATDGASPAWEHADYVRLEESRRVRLKELHYFDHPLFGVIVQVTRLGDDNSE